MAGIYNYPEGGSHPSIYANNPLAKMSTNTKDGEALHDFFTPITERLHAIMSQQFIPITDNTLASLVDETNIFLSSVVRLHIENYDGWVADIFPLKEAPALFFRARVWTDVPQAMEPAAEGVAPQVMMHEFEDYWYALRRYNIGNKAQHAALQTAEGLRVWLLKLSMYPSAFVRTCQLASLDAIDSHPSSYARQMEAQGTRKFTSIADAMNWELETYLLGSKEKGIYKLAHMANQQLISAGDQEPFNRIIFPFGARQRLAYSEFESDLVHRGPKALANIEGGGAAWQSAGLPGFILYEAGLLNYVNFGNNYAPFRRNSLISTYFCVDGRAALDFAIENYDPEAELSVEVRDTKTSPSLNSYVYEQALRDCHRFDDDGYLDKDAHRDMLSQLSTMMNFQDYSMTNQQDLDPFVWHHPTEPVDPRAPGYHICDVYGDVPEGFRGHKVDDKHGEAFAILASKYLGEEGISKIGALREVVARLERPPSAIWTEDILGAWVAAVAGSTIVEGAFDVPEPVEGLGLPYGYTTIAGIRALARRHNVAAGAWSAEAQSMFRIANDAWTVIKRLWSLVRRVYPECLLVKSGRFVPAWMETSNDETNAFYSIMANFFDVSVRYPVWSMGGGGGRPGDVSGGDLGGLGLATSNDRVAAFNAGILDDNIVARIKNEPARMRKAYREHIGPAYQRLIKDEVPAASTELETFFAQEVDSVSGAQGASIAAGILALTYEALFVSSSSPLQSITRELINSWKARAPHVSRTSADAGEGVNSRLSFHSSVWKSEQALALKVVAPADPTQRNRSLPQTEAGYEFARSAMFIDPLETRSGMDVERPMDQDLGSLDELDDDQLLYPFLYQKDSNIFWKFNDDLRKHDLNYYLWHRVQHLRVIDPDQFAKLGTLCMLFSSISIPADLACVRNKIPPPDLCFMGVHFAIRQRTQGIVLARGNGEAGATYWKYFDNLVGVDPVAKEWTSHFEAWIGTAVLDPRYVMFHRDVFPDGGITGLDTSSVPRNFNMTHVNLDKALMTMYVGSEFTRRDARTRANPFPLSGRFDPNYLGSASFDDDTESMLTSPDTPPFPGFWFYARLHGLQQLHSMNRWSYRSAADEMRQDRYHPGVVFMEGHVSGMGESRKRHQGTGHTRDWPDNVRDISEGTQVFRTPAQV